MRNIIEPLLMQKTFVDLVSQWELNPNDYFSQRGEKQWLLTYVENLSILKGGKSIEGCTDKQVGSLFCRVYNKHYKEVYGKQ